MSHVSTGLDRRRFNDLGQPTFPCSSSKFRLLNFPHLYPFGNFGNVPCSPLRPGTRARFSARFCDRGGSKLTNFGGHPGRSDNSSEEIWQGNCFIPRRKRPIVGRTTVSRLPEEYWDGRTEHLSPIVVISVKGNFEIFEILHIVFRKSYPCKISF